MNYTVFLDCVQGCGGYDTRFTDIPLGSILPVYETIKGICPPCEEEQRHYFDEGGSD